MNRRAVAVGALALFTAGCGSTVQLTGPGQGGTAGGQSLSVPGGTTGTGAPGSASGGTGAITAGGAVQGGAGGSNLAAGQGTTQTGGASQGSATDQGDGPGVTATTINVAAAYDPDVAAADAALGAGNADPGDTKAETEAVIKYINTHGGVAHRKINPIWYKVSAYQDSNTSQQDECAYWTQDNKVFVNAAGTPIWDECTAKSGGIAVLAGAIALETSAQNQRYPQDINITSFTIDHSMSVTINGLAKQGYFNNGAKVGVITWDDPYYHYGMAKAGLPALAALGLRNVPVQYVTVPASAQDVGQTSASAGNAVLKFRTMGIDHVIVLDGPAGINNSGVLWLEWAQQANSQQYYPKHGLNSTSGFNAFGSEIPQQEMEGAEGVGWLPSLEETSTDWAHTPLPPNGHLCFQIMKDAGQQQSGANAQAVQLSICDNLFFLKQTLDKVTGPLNRSTALAAINAVGSAFASSVTFGVNINANKHDGAFLVRNMQFQDGCKCFRYTSPGYNPF